MTSRLAESASINIFVFLSSAPRNRMDMTLGGEKIRLNRYGGCKDGGVIRVRHNAINRLGIFGVATNDQLLLLGEGLLKTCTEMARSFLLWLVSIPYAWKKFPRLVCRLS